MCSSDLQRCGQLADPADLGPALATARTTHHDQHRPGIIERGQAPNGQVRALQRLDPAREEQHPSGVDPQSGPGRVAVAREEHGVIDPGGDDLDAGRIAGVELGELAALLDGRGQHEVGAGDDLVFDHGALRRVVIDPGVGLHPGQRVEGRSQRQVHLVLEAVAHRAREPVVRVDDVGAPALEVGPGRSGEVVDEVVGLVERLP